MAKTLKPKKKVEETASQVKEVKQVQEPVKPIPTYNVFQACNHYKLSGTNRRVATTLFGESRLTLENWGETLKSKNLL